MRHFEFSVDRGHARAVNETLSDVRRLQWSSVVFAVMLAAGVAWMVYLHHPWSYILAAVLTIAAATALWVAFWVPRKVGSIESLYARSALVPAMISELRPRGATLMALIDVAKPEASVPHFALVVRAVQDIPGHKFVEGERVPSVAVLNDRSTTSMSETWQMVSPMPIAWGTRDRTVMRRAIESIDPAEWTVLQSCLSMTAEVRASDNLQLILDPDVLPVELLRRAVED